MPSLSLLILIVFDAPTPLTMHSSLPLSVESFERFHHKKPPGCRGSACVEVMITLHGSALSLRRRVEGCVPSKGTIASTKDPLNQTEVASPVIVPTPTLKDPHARMDRLEQRLRRLRTLDRVVTWDDFDGLPMASLPAKFKMPEIERYTGIGCPRIHLRLYSTIMRARGLDEAQMIMFFPMSLSGATQQWFSSLDVSCRQTWDDLT
ncbi:hypothetical protein AAG906_013711 [Vitis piasezkii]